VAPEDTPTTTPTGEDGCVVCGRAIDEGARFLLLARRRHQAHCSELCLRAHARARQRARTRARRRWAWRLTLPLALLVVVGAAWRRFHAPPRQGISAAWPEAIDAEARPAPSLFGPPWPPTDEQWAALLDASPGTFPLPGPTRRPLTVDEHLFGPAPPRELPPRCRVARRCGVDLGGELWGEHVYAAFDGVVERVQGDGNEHGGGRFVRLSHFGGMVFTQYFHLAAVPRGLGRGAHVQAGDVIGLLGDSGLDGARRHLHVSLSIRPPGAFPEVYWDPTPWMEKWPMRLPPNGTVAGYTPRSGNAR
jgi:predicted nucleic acid-binding Zn ribbon protein